MKLSICTGLKIIQYEYKTYWSSVANVRCFYIKRLQINIDIDLFLPVFVDQDQKRDQN